MREVNLGALVDYFDLELSKAIRGALSDQGHRLNPDDNELVRFFLMALRRTCPSAEYEAVERVGWAMNQALRETVEKFGFPTDPYWLGGIRRNLPSRLADWVSVPDGIAR